MAYFNKKDNFLASAILKGDKGDKGDPAFTLIATHTIPVYETGFTIYDERICNHIVMLVTRMYNGTTGVCFAYNMDTSWPGNHSTYFPVMGDSGSETKNAFYSISDGYATLNGVDTSEGDWTCFVYDTGIEIPFVT